MTPEEFSRISTARSAEAYIQDIKRTDERYQAKYVEIAQTPGDYNWGIVDQFESMTHRVRAEFGVGPVTAAERETLAIFTQDTVAIDELDMPGVRNRLGSVMGSVAAGEEFNGTYSLQDIREQERFARRSKRNLDASKRSQRHHYHSRILEE